jgi:hypothetical protein
VRQIKYLTTSLKGIREVKYSHIPELHLKQKLNPLVTAVRLGLCFAAITDQLQSGIE